MPSSGHDAAAIRAQMQEKAAQRATSLPSVASGGGNGSPSAASIRASMQDKAAARAKRAPLRGSKSVPALGGARAKRSSRSGSKPAGGGAVTLQPLQPSRRQSGGTRAAGLRPTASSPALPASAGDGGEYDMTAIRADMRTKAEKRASGRSLQSATSAAPRAGAARAGQRVARTAPASASASASQGSDPLQLHRQTGAAIRIQYYVRCFSKRLLDRLLREEEEHFADQRRKLIDTLDAVDDANDKIEAEESSVIAKVQERSQRHLSQAHIHSPHVAGQLEPLSPAGGAAQRSAFPDASVTFEAGTPSPLRRAVSPAPARELPWLSGGGGSDSASSAAAAAAAGSGEQGDLAEQLERERSARAIERSELTSAISQIAGSANELVSEMALVKAAAASQAAEWAAERGKLTSVVSGMAESASQLATDMTTVKAAQAAQAAQWAVERSQLEETASAQATELELLRKKLELWCVKRLASLFSPPLFLYVCPEPVLAKRFSYGNSTITPFFCAGMSSLA
jgi:hypothetical protein